MSVDVSEDIVKRFPIKLSGYDEEGCYSKFILLVALQREQKTQKSQFFAVAIIHFGKFDYRYVVENDKKEDFYPFHLKCCELCYELVKFKTTPSNFVHQHVGITDCEGLSMRQFTSTASELAHKLIDLLTLTSFHNAILQHVMVSYACLIMSYTNKLLDINSFFPSYQGRQYIMELMAQAEANYPEMMKKTIVVNGKFRSCFNATP